MLKCFHSHFQNNKKPARTGKWTKQLKHVQVINVCCYFATFVITTIKNTVVLKKRHNRGQFECCFGDIDWGRGGGMSESTWEKNHQLFCICLKFVLFSAIDSCYLFKTFINWIIIFFIVPVHWPLKFHIHIFQNKKKIIGNSICLSINKRTATHFEKAFINYYVKAGKWINFPKSTLNFHTTLEYETSLFFVGNFCNAANDQGKPNLWFDVFDNATVISKQNWPIGWWYHTSTSRSCCSKYFKKCSSTRLQRMFPTIPTFAQSLQQTKRQAKDCFPQLLPMPMNRTSGPFPLFFVWTKWTVSFRDKKNV